jgi:hypothetical protein
MCSESQLSKSLLAPAVALPLKNTSGGFLISKVDHSGGLNVRKNPNEN